MDATAKSENQQTAQTMPEVVYHYTSLDALVSIVEKRELWATNILYLNDQSERSLFLQQAQPFMEAEAAKRNLSFGYNDGYRERIELLPFVCSFSANQNSLTQWRAYCPCGMGVSIGFRTKSLLETTMCEPPEQIDERLYIDFKPITYVKPTNSQLAQKSATQVWDQVSTTHGRRLQVAMAESFINTEASFHKHETFMSEQEFRLTASPVYNTEARIKFRSSRSTLLPYVRITLPGLDAISSILVGPSPNADLTVAAVKSLCRCHHLEAPVLSCDLPYRDW